MINENQAGALLKVATAYDNRQPNKSSVLSWLDAGNRENWDFNAALDAVKQHYARSTDFIQPGHVTQLVKHSARQPEPVVSVRAQIASAEAHRASDEHRERCRTEVAERLGWQVPDSPELSVVCPKCGMEAGRPCGRETRRGQWVPLPRPHPSRRVTIVEGQTA